MITAITGKVGSGKNLFAIQKIIDYAAKGRRIVTNFKVDLAPVQPLWKRWLRHPVHQVEQIPARPTFEDVRRLGKGGEREHVAGLLVLDEVGPLLNARSWQDKDRSAFIDWLLHSRKLAWDILLIVQNVNLVDKQIRIAVVESLVTIRRMDRLKLPLLGVPLPRIHMAVERYGTEPHAPIAERTFFRGNRLFQCYDTTEVLMGNDQADEPAPINQVHDIEPEPSVQYWQEPGYLEPFWPYGAEGYQRKPENIVHIAA
ncbi:zonular occludens toxin domain-containing protein [Sedimenticola sp.]|uniref:zonular occludens toxin domain-containing protein n=1 Tax=Sedimenticola sp. TaxID=1940285 RepID=UPI003D111A19